MPVWKRRQKGLRVSNFTLLGIVFKWPHGSEGVNIIYNTSIDVTFLIQKCAVIWQIQKCAVVITTSLRFTLTCSIPPCPLLAHMRLYRHSACYIYHSVCLCIPHQPSAAAALFWELGKSSVSGSWGCCASGLHFNLVASAARLRAVLGLPHTHTQHV